jgi:hypothetical protein
MNIQIIHEGACSTQGCGNSGVVFDAPSIDGVVQPIICGVCGIDFSDNCKLK